MSAVPNFTWEVAFKEFAHPGQPLSSAIKEVGPTFFLATDMFGFVFQMTSLIAEKELKLREVSNFKLQLIKLNGFTVLSYLAVYLFDHQAMTMMGLYDTAYWLSWLTWEGIKTVFSSLFILLFGMMFQFDFFLKNSFPVLYLIFFLFQLNMVRLILSYCLILYSC